MYRHYESSEDVFVDREEHIKWMNEALERCKKKSVVLHLKGIGGIGKSSLLNHWINTHEKTIRLDCYQYSDFFQRLNILAKGAVLQGVKLQRFDILWQIRQRFVEGVEPVKEDGRAWAKEVVMAIPFIGSLASIGSAINAVGSKVTPKLKGKYGTIGKWLQEQLGKNHVESLLEILWKEPRRAEFLYLSAFMEDINSRDNSSNPLLFLFDHFEHVDDEITLWKYMKRRINESELWTIFLSNLSNCVGVLASRKPADKIKQIEIEETELLELDRDSCFEMLDLQDVADKELQERIMSVSGGNPFVIDAICDMINTSDVSKSDIESFRADDLAEVRLKVWRRLFSQAEGLHNLINRAGIVPYFDERIMRIISPELTPDRWDRMRRLSFVVMRSDGTFVLHELAKDLVRAELANRLGDLVDEVSELLEKKHNEESDIVLLGLAISVRALKEPKKILLDFEKIWDELSWKMKMTEALMLCDTIQFNFEEGRVCLKIVKSHFLVYSDRIADGEHEIRDALEEVERISTITEIERKRYRAQTKARLAALFKRTRRQSEAINEYEEAIALAREVNIEPPDHLPPGQTQFELSRHLWMYGNFLDDLNKLNQAEAVFHEAIEQWESWAKQVGELPSLSERRYLLYYQISIGYIWMRIGKLSEAETIFKSVLKDVQEPHLIGLCDLYLAETYLLMNRPSDALEKSTKGVKAYSKFPEHTFANLRAHSCYARSLYLLGRYSEALPKIEEILQIARESLEIAPEIYSATVASILRIYGVFLKQNGKISKADAAYHEALNLRRELTHFSPEVTDMEIAWTLSNLGVLHFKNGDISKAERNYFEGLELGRGPAKYLPEVVDNVECVAVILNNLGNLYLSTDRIKEAREAFEEALAIYEQLSRLSVELVQPSQATVLNNLGVLLISVGDISDAEKKLQKSLSIRMELEERDVGYHKVCIGSTLNNLGILHFRREEYPEALDLFRKATDKLEEAASKSSLDCIDELSCSLINQYITISKIDSDSRLLENLMKRLKELDVEKVESESLILDDLESYILSF